MSDNRYKDDSLSLYTTIDSLSINARYNMVNMICSMTLLSEELGGEEEDLYLMCVIPMLAKLNSQYYLN